MTINSVILFSCLIFAISLVGGIGFQKAYLILFSLLVILVVLVWFYIINRLKSRGTPADSRLFRDSLEIHIGKKAMGNPKLFIVLFLESVIWASDHNIKKAVFFTWYGNERTFGNYFGSNVTISKPGTFEDIANIYVNPHYWFHNTGKQHAKVVINVSQLSAEDITRLNLIKARLER